MTHKAMTSLRSCEVAVPSETGIAETFLAFRDLFVLCTLIFFLLRIDTFLFREGLLPIAPIIIMFFWIVSIWVLSIVSSMFEREYPLIFVRCLPIIVPFAAIVGFSWAGIFLQGAYLDDNYKSILLPTLDFGIFLTGIVIGIMCISDRKWSAAMMITFTCIMVTTFIDVLYPGTFSNLNYRAAGLFENPNEAAFGMILFLAILLRWKEKTFNLHDVFFGTICGIGVFFTFSRGGVILYLLIVFLYWLNLRSEERIAFIIKGIVFLVCLAGVIVFLLPDYISQLEILQSDSVRLQWFSGDIGDAFLTSDSRFELLYEYLLLIAASPFWGHGSGYVSSMWLGPHNLYLARWTENGIFGLLSYLWLLAAVLLINKMNKNFQGVAVVLIIAVFGLTSHNVLENRAVLLMMAILTTRAIARQTIGVQGNKIESE